VGNRGYLAKTADPVPLVLDLRVAHERLKPKDDESTCLVYTGLLEELEYLKIETRLIDEMFASVMGEYVFLK
jgi:hypothetical protein